MVRTRDLTTGGIVAALAVGSVLFLPRLPSEMAIHFDATGEPDSFAQAEVFLAGSVLLGAGLAALYAVLPRIDPLGDNVAEFQTAYDGIAVATVAFHAYVHGLVVATNLDIEFDVIQATAPAVAVLYLVVAGLLWRAEQNWFVGIRTPWTLSSERVWERTHRRTAPLFAVAGVLALGGVLAPDYGVVLMSGPVTAVALWAVLYSFVVYRRLESPG